MTPRTKQTFIVAFGLIGLFAVIKHASVYYPLTAELGFVATFLYQIFIPIWLIEKEGSTLSRYKIGFLDWKNRFDLANAGADLKRVAFMVLGLFPIHWLVYHFWYLNHPGFTAPNPDFSWLNFVLTQFLLVALAEEIFYRGFIQTRLLQEWPNQKFLLGIPVGFAIIITSAIFALGHFIGEYNVGRLGPFFPAFLFSFLAFRSKSILGAVVFHALCNIFAQLLHVVYFWK